MIRERRRALRERRRRLCARAACGAESSGKHQFAIRTRVRITQGRRCRRVPRNLSDKDPGSRVGHANPRTTTSLEDWHGELRMAFPNPFSLPPVAHDVGHLLQAFAAQALFHALPFRVALVLARLPLSFDARDRQLDADDPAEHALEILPW